MNERPLLDLEGFNSTEIFRNNAVPDSDNRDFKIQVSNRLKRRETINSKSKVPKEQNLQNICKEIHNLKSIISVLQNKLQEGGKKNNVEEINFGNISRI